MTPINESCSLCGGKLYLEMNAKFSCTQSECPIVKKQDIMSEENWYAIAKRNVPHVRPSKRKILKCSKPEYWYANLVGSEVEVTIYGSYGGWDSEGRWMCFYDLGEEII